MHIVGVELSPDRAETTAKKNSNLKILVGLITSTALNMIVVPSLYFKFGKNIK